MTFFKNLVRDEQGATAIEYGLIAALIAVAAIGAMSALGTSLSGTFDNVSTEVAKGNAGGSTSGGTAPAPAPAP